MNDYSRYNGNGCKPVTTSLVISFFQEIRQGGNSRFYIKRNEEQGKQNQCKGGHPFKIAVQKSGIES